jgi:NADPH2:quinone reductase
VTRRGDFSLPYPLIPGVEGSGWVEQTGPGVTGLRVGDRVSWAPVKLGTSIGSYAEFAAVHAEQAIPIPDDVTFEQAAALTLQGLAAHYLATEQIQAGPGVTALVHAAAGGTGALVVQWLKHLGATVIGTVSTEQKAAVATAAGADHVVLYTREDFAAAAQKLTGGRGVDYIVDGVSGPDFGRNLDALAVRGRVCVFGRTAGLPGPVDPMALLGKSLTISGGSMPNFLRTREELLRKANDVWEALRAGWLAPRIHALLPLADAAEAHRQLEARGTTGKLVLSVAQAATRQPCGGPMPTEWLPRRGVTGEKLAS